MPRAFFGSCFLRHGNPLARCLLAVRAPSYYSTCLLAPPWTSQAGLDPPSGEDWRGEGWISPTDVRNIDAIDASLRTAWAWGVVMLAVSANPSAGPRAGGKGSGGHHHDKGREQQAPRRNAKGRSSSGPPTAPLTN